jgi:hypothetical protein
MEVAKFNAQPVRDIVLHRTPNASHVVTVAYSQPTATDSKTTTTAVDSTPNVHLTPPSLDADQPIRNPAIPTGSTTTDQVIAAINTEPVAPKTEGSTLHVDARGDMTSRLPTPSSKILKKIPEPTCETSDSGHGSRRESSSQNITIMAGDDEHVERITITGPSSTKTQSVPATNSHDTRGTIRIRTSNENVERIPVKAIDAND